MEHLDDDIALEELLLTTSELVTNAIKFSRGQRPLWIHVLVTPQHVAVTVTNAASEDWRGAMPGEATSDAAEGGRGLGIVRDLSDEFAVLRGSSTMVRAARHRAMPSQGRVGGDDRERP